MSCDHRRPQLERRMTVLPTKYPQKNPKMSMNSEVSREQSLIKVLHLSLLKTLILD